MSNTVVLLFGCLAVVHQLAIAGPVSQPAEKAETGSDTTLPTHGAQNDQKVSKAPESTDDDFVLPDLEYGEPNKIDFEALKEGLGKSKYTLIDVRPREMVAEEGQIPGSNNIPLPEIEQAFKNMTEEEFKEKYGFDRPAKPGTDVVIYCKKAIYARRAVGILRPMGYTDVILYEGSFTEWQAKGAEIERVPPLPAVSKDAAASDAVKPATAEQELPKSEDNKNKDEKKESSAVKEDQDGEDADARRERDRYKPQTRPADLSGILPNRGAIDSNPAARPSSLPRQRDYFTIKVIGYEELKRLLAEPSRQILVVDTSTADEFKARKIPGSFNVPVAEIDEAKKLSGTDFIAKYGFPRPTPPARNLVITARKACDSYAAVKHAIAEGYTSAMWYADGVDDWIAKGGSVEGAEAAAA